MFTKKQTNYTNKLDDCRSYRSVKTYNFRPKLLYTSKSISQKTVNLNKKPAKTSKRVLSIKQFLKQYHFKNKQS
jgi:hypothetical protein